MVSPAEEAVLVEPCPSLRLLERLLSVGSLMDLHREDNRGKLVWKVPCNILKNEDGLFMVLWT